MLVHTVFFWLEDEVTPEQREAFRSALESLLTIDTVEAGFVGTPAAVPERPVCETGYDFALTVLLADVAAHDAYQAAPEHTAFVDANRQLWQRVQVYDAD